MASSDDTSRNRDGAIPVFERPAGAARIPDALQKVLHREWQESERRREQTQSETIQPPQTIQPVTASDLAKKIMERIRLINEGGPYERIPSEPYFTPDGLGNNSNEMNPDIEPTEYGSVPRHLLPPPPKRDENCPLFRRFRQRRMAEMLLERIPIIVTEREDSDNSN